MSRGGLIVVGDGRTNYLLQALEHLPAYDWAVKVLVDDTGNGRYHSWLEHHLADDGWEFVFHPLRLGGWGSVRSAFRAAVGHDLDWWFHLEEDFIVGDVDVAAMADTVMSTDGLAQMALLRQPVNAVELQAGNWLLQRGDFVQHDGWVEQPWFFCLNPMVARREIAERYQWPQGGHEHHFTKLLAADGWRFGVWGDVHDQPRCLHIGTQRSEEWAW